MTYNLDEIDLNRNVFKKRLHSLWRYREFLPIENVKDIVDLGAGYTLLHKCERLAKKLGIKKLYVKNDTVNPSGSFKR